MQTGFFVVGSLCQHPEPDEMALESPLKREMGTVCIVGSEALGMPVERRHALEDGLERLHIQGKPGRTMAPSCSPPTSATGVG